MNAFHVLGALFAVWALALAATGIARENFPRTRRSAVAAGSVSVALALAAIGSAIITSALEDEEEEAADGRRAAPGGAARKGGSGARFRLLADPGGALRFDKRQLRGKAGEITLVLRNPASIPHNVAIEGRSVDEQGPTVGQGRRSTVTAQLRRGRYTFYCSVPGHRQGGMEGELLVE